MFSYLKKKTLEQYSLKSHYSYILAIFSNNHYIIILYFMEKGNNQDIKL